MFTGFTENTIHYLNNLRLNNNKTWFEENRFEYEQHLLGKFKELVTALMPAMLEIDPFMDTRVNKCISRIHRDVRFTKDKSPYRSNMWFSIKREYKDWKQEPTFYFELFPDGYRFGMGFYDIPKELLEKIRKMIEMEDEHFLEMHAAYKAQKLFRLEGDFYKRTLNEAIPEEYRVWYQKKEIFFVCDRKLDQLLFSEELVKELADSFRKLLPMYQFFLMLRGRS